ncbi:MAG TPA: histidine triad nucleotide-binding protein, partial [Clostridiales bacterium]|nr:histidine triad nucleotide-binding protein [Clostridiales bacterium]
NLNALEEVDYAMLPEIYRVIAKLTATLGIRDTGYRVITNTGTQGGQTVSHLHFHLIGGRALPWSF